MTLWVEFQALGREKDATGRILVREAGVSLSVRNDYSSPWCVLSRYSEKGCSKSSVIYIYIYIYMICSIYSSVYYRMMLFCFLFLPTRLQALSVASVGAPKNPKDMAYLMHLFAGALGLPVHVV